MKKAKYLCKIGYRDILTHDIVSIYAYTNKTSDIIEYAKEVHDKTTFLQKLEVVDNATGELLIVTEFHTNEYYICSSARKLASKILRKI